MNSIALLLFAFLSVINALNYCEIYSNGNTKSTANCADFGPSVCADYYNFSWNALTAVPTNLYAKPCKWNGSTCVMDTFNCMPSCLLRKTGGPSGQICSDFTTQTNCANYYADNSGDRWCAWNTATSTCYEAVICHN
jgi:hypothetical protein